MGIFDTQQPTSGIFAPQQPSQQQDSGIFGSIGSALSSPAGQGLLAAGLGALASRGTTTQAIGRGGLLGLSAYGQSAQDQDNKMRQRAQELAKQNALNQLSNGETSPAIFSAAGYDDPTKWNDLINYKNNKIKQTQTTTDANGNQSIHTIDNYGNVNNTGLTNAPEIKTQDIGGQITGINPYTGQQAWGVDKTQTLGERETARHNFATENLTLRGQNMTDARARESNQNGKIPQGYRLTADGQSLEAIPGGPADIKSGELGAKREAQKQANIASANSVINKVDQALDLVGKDSFVSPTAGYGSGAWSTIGGTNARNLQSNLETIKANLGFDRLQQMRDNSPTGGALGAVAVQELEALQSSVASLDQGQSPAQLKRNLNEVKQHYNNWLKAVNGTQLQGQQQPQQQSASQGGRKYNPATGRIE